MRITDVSKRVVQTNRQRYITKDMIIINLKDIRKSNNTTFNKRHVATCFIWITYIEIIK